MMMMMMMIWFSFSVQFIHSSLSLSFFDYLLHMLFSFCHQLDCLWQRAISVKASLSFFSFSRHQFGLISTLGEDDLLWWWKRRKSVPALDSEVWYFIVCFSLFFSRPRKFCLCFFSKRKNKSGFYQLQQQQKLHNVLLSVLFFFISSPLSSL